MQRATSEMQMERWPQVVGIFYRRLISRDGTWQSADLGSRVSDVTGDLGHLFFWTAQCGPRWMVHVQPSQHDLLQISLMLTHPHSHSFRVIVLSTGESCMANRLQCTEQLPAHHKVHSHRNPLHFKTFWRHRPLNDEESLNQIALIQKKPKPQQQQKNTPASHLPFNLRDSFHFQSLLAMLISSFQTSSH